MKQKPLRATNKGVPAQITNRAEWKEGKPIALRHVSRLAVKCQILFEPTENDWKYAHHQSIAAFNNRLFAIWSSSLKDEDTPGQRVMYALRDEAGAWSKPRVLFQPDIDPDGRLRVLTAAGFHSHNGYLVAYAGDYSDDRKTTNLLARISQDGERWGAVRNLNVPVCPNHGPQRTASGRLIIAGNTAFPYTDDPTGLTGWKMTGIYPPSMEPFQDNPTTFWEACKVLGGPNLCEGAFYQTGNHVLRMLLRATSLDKSAESLLWESLSFDDGTTWSPARKTAFSNTDAKFHFGRLPDGRFYCVGNPLATDWVRMPLVLSTSRDGVRFDQHFILGDKHYLKRFEGAFKGGEYSYPHTLVHAGSLYVIFARQKEAIEVMEVPLSELRDGGPSKQ